jgi:uncharacterized protein HemX
MDPRTMKMLEERRQASANAPPPPSAAQAFQTKATAWFQKNRTSVGAGAAALVVVVVVGRYTMVTLPARKQEQIVQRTQEAEAQARAQEEQLSSCLAELDKTYTADVDKACRASKQGADCSLPRATSRQIDQSRLDGRIDCFRKFGPR